LDVIIAINPTFFRVSHNPYFVIIGKHSRVEGIREEREPRSGHCAIEETFGRKADIGPQRGQRAIEGTEYSRGGQRAAEGT
jgi:hypothetical protein